jgi:hypothetical protein
MNRKTKKCNKQLTRTFKNKPPNVKRRRPQHGGAFHVDLGHDRRPIDGNRYKIISTQTDEDGSLEFIYYGYAKVIYAASSQICREESSERCQAPMSYHADGKGNLIEFASDGSFSVYEGQFANQEKNGRGKCSYFLTTPPLLLEEFRQFQFRTMEDLNIMPHNQFTELTNQLSQHTPYKVYKGNWVNNHMTGVGELTFADGTCYKGHWENGVMSGRGTLRQTDGSFYRGNFSDGHASGFGKMTYATRDVYVGHWQNDMISGRGQMTYANGDVYFGHWQNDTRSGRGQMTYANGDVYVGDWQNDMRSGRGQYTYANGDVYVGDWQNNMRSGRGQYTYANGDVHVLENDEIISVVNAAQSAPMANHSGFQSSANIFTQPGHQSFANIFSRPS